MTIAFNNIPTTIRTPGVYTEVDNSQSLKGFVQNPHKALIVGQKETAGTAIKEVLLAIPNEIVADGYFGVGSILARMCRTFKQNNPNTELYAVALSEATTVQASACISFAGSATKTGTMYLMIGGVAVDVPITSGMSMADVASVVQSEITKYPQTMCVTASVVTSQVLLKAIGSGILMNQWDVRKNYYDGQSDVPGLSICITGMAGGTGVPTYTGTWAAIDTTQFQHIINPYNDAASLTVVQTELTDRFSPSRNQQGYAYTAIRGALASCATVGLSNNNPHMTLMGYYDSPTNPELWSAALGAVCAAALNNDPARPLHYLTLKGILSPAAASRWTQAERNVLLYDGISTHTVDPSGNVVIERMITTYRVNTLNSPDPSYLNTNTMFTLMELRYQYNTRMSNRFIIPRFKLASDSFPVQPGSYVATPKTIKQEIIALFTQLQDIGLIEELDTFIANLVVERDASDVNRVNVLLAPNLINQFQILASVIQYIL